jgi:hypothetical protein
MDPAIMAAITIAFEETMSRSSSQPAEEPASGWRFSGRWWNQPTARLRPRPWLA